MTISPPNSPSSPVAPPSARAKLTARLRAWYAACAPRERRLLAIAASVALGGCLITLADHLANERQRLTHTLPAARLAYLAMEQDSLGLAALRERPPPAAPPLAALPNSISSAASARGFTVEPRLTADSIVVVGTTSLPALVDWLAALQAEQRLRPRRLELQPASTDGYAPFEAVFEVSAR